MGDPKKYLDKDGLLYLWSKITGKFVAKENGKGLSTNDFTDDLETKLDGIATGAEVNQNAFSNVTVGNVTVAAGSKTDTFELKAGSNVTVTGNASTKEITIAATDTTYSEATTSTAGLMSSSDKTKLDGIESGAEVNTISSIKVNGTAQTITSKEVDITVPTAVSDLTNDSGYQTASDVSTAISTAISSTYKPKGSVAFVSLPTLGSTYDGCVYNVTDAFTTTSDFVEGSGKKYPAGTNVVCINTATTGTAVYKWDVLAGFIDTSNFVTFDDIVAITNAEIDTIVAS